MDIRKIYNTQNFNGLNYSRVSSKGLKLVTKDLPQLEELGKKYDIKLWSRFSDILNTEFINIDVNPLNKKIGFLYRVFTNRGKSYCKADSESLVDAVNKTISTLK